MPRVAVLMATLNGDPWLQSQVASILGQDGVSVRLIVSDDGSTDDTLQVLSSLTHAFPGRIELLPTQSPTGGASQNFFRLIRDATINEDEYVAFADQDDLWEPQKLSYQVRQLTERHVDGTSSSVVAFNGAGRKRLIKKNWPEAEFDYLFQSPGPGSTHVLTPRAFNLIRRMAIQHDLSTISYHDWLDYALVRARGWSWFVSSKPLVAYRQHQTNTMGANIGARARFDRLRMLKQGWYRHQVLTICQLSREVAPSDEDRAHIDEIAHLISTQSWRNKFRLARRADQFRRSPRDKMFLKALIILGIW